LVSEDFIQPGQLISLAGCYSMAAVTCWVVWPHFF